MIKRVMAKACRAIMPRLLADEIKQERLREEWLVLNSVPDAGYEPLTADEKFNVQKVWGAVVGTELSYREFEVYKKARGFDARFMPMSFYLPLISRRLNNYHYTKFFEHKSLLGYLVAGGVKFPRCVVRCVNGECFSNDMQQISKDSAVDLCMAEQGIVVKDSVGSSGGAGIEILRFSRMTLKEKADEINRIFKERRRDFVVQPIIKEHDSLARFNPSSVNSIRLQTLYLNGRVSVHSIIFRTGNTGSRVDNLCSGGIVVGVHHDGSLHKYGYDLQVRRYEGRGDLIFAKERIAQIPQLIKLVENAHVRLFPLCKYIGWDFVFDEDNQPICLEVNSSQNGHLIFQICCGPTFGDRTQEVIDYCKGKEFIYGRSICDY